MKESGEMTFKIQTEQFANVYKVSTEIGRGKFAVVKRCTHLKTGIDYAAKFIRKRRKGVDCRKDVIHEICMLEMTLVHPNFVNLVEVYETTHDLILVTELVKGGELFQIIYAEGQLEETCAVRLMRQILQGLKFLHNLNIAHLDIKPQNILLTEPLPHGNVKLCDLGLARNFKCGEDIFEIIGTPDYVAPEILDYQKLNSACDMWSIGVLAYVMLSGCSPFAGDTNQETFLNISQVNLDFPDQHFGGISKDAIDFISKLLMKEPENRMTVSECLEHPWLKPPCTFVPSLCDSPLGQRRSTSDVTLHEPIKRCRCDSLSVMDNVTDAETITTSVEKENVIQIDSVNDNEMPPSDEPKIDARLNTTNEADVSSPLGQNNDSVEEEEEKLTTKLNDLNHLYQIRSTSSSSSLSRSYFEHISVWPGDFDRLESSGIPV